MCRLPYGFDIYLLSKCQNRKKDGANFCGLLRKAELYYCIQMLSGLNFCVVWAYSEFINFPGGRPLWREGEEGGGRRGREEQLRPRCGRTRSLNGGGRRRRKEAIKSLCLSERAEKSRAKLKPPLSQTRPLGATELRMVSRGFNQTI